MYIYKPDTNLECSLVFRDKSLVYEIKDLVVQMKDRFLRADKFGYPKNHSYKHVSLVIIVNSPVIFIIIKFSYENI